jgi:hypothetical protein
MASAQCHHDLADSLDMEKWMAEYSSRFIIQALG